MSDLYYELLVKKNQTAKDKLTKFGLIGAIVILGVGGILLNPIFLIAAMILGIVAYFVLPSTDIEFEYLFVNGEMDVDRVMSKTKRKRAKSFSIKDAEIIASMKSHRLEYYKNNQKMKTLDFSSGDPEHFRLAVITRDGTEPCMIIIEPDEKLTGQIKYCAPSKVFLD